MTPRRVTKFWHEKARMLLIRAFAFLGIPDVWPHFNSAELLSRRYSKVIATKSFFETEIEGRLSSREEHGCRS